MKPLPHNLQDLKTPWELVDAQCTLDLELKRETNPLHLLFQVKSRALARRCDCDDVLFHVDKEETPLAVVHLTWSGKRDLHPNFPSTEFFQSWEDFIDKRMKPDHQDYFMD